MVHRELLYYYIILFSLHFTCYGLGLTWLLLLYLHSKCYIKHATFTLTNTFFLFISASLFNIQTRGIQTGAGRDQITNLASYNQPLVRSVGIALLPSWWPAVCGKWVIKLQRSNTSISGRKVVGQISYNMRILYKLLYF